MKLITRDTDYAIRALVCIASTTEGRVSVTELSDMLDMPHPFLRKILQKLNRAGILDSVKGKGGGFKLSSDPAEITILRMMEVFQGPFSLSVHVFKGELCPRIKKCFLKKKLDSMQAGIEKELKSITIASLIKNW